MGTYVITGADDGSGVAIVDVDTRETVGTAATVDLAVATVDALRATAPRRLHRLTSRSAWDY